MANQYYLGPSLGEAFGRGVKSGLDAYDAQKQRQRQHQDDEWRGELREHQRGLMPLEADRARLGIERDRLGLETARTQHDWALEDRPRNVEAAELSLGSARLGLETAQRQHDWAGEDRPSQVASRDRQDEAAEMELNRLRETHSTDALRQALDRVDAIMNVGGPVRQQDLDSIADFWNAQSKDDQITGLRPGPGDTLIVDFIGDDGRPESAEFSPRELRAALFPPEQQWTRLNDSTIFDKGSGSVRDMGGAGLSGPGFGSGGMSPFNYQTNLNQIAGSVVQSMGGTMNESGQFFLPPGQEEMFNVVLDAAQGIARSLLEAGAPAALSPGEIVAISRDATREVRGLTRAESEQMARREMRRASDEQVAERAAEIREAAHQQYYAIVQGRLTRAFSGGEQSGPDRAPIMTPPGGEGGGLGLSPPGAGLQIPPGPVGAASPGAGGESLPPRAAERLREGVNTRFANGQTWTLQGGQPVRVQ